MLPKELLIKFSKKDRTECSPSGCPMYELYSKTEEQLNDMYLYLTKEPKGLYNSFSVCSEAFLQICYKFNKKNSKKLFEKYVDNGNNFYVGTNQMPCSHLKEMAKFMLQKRAIDIE